MKLVHVNIPSEVQREGKNTVLRGGTNVCDLGLLLPEQFALCPLENQIGRQKRKSVYNGENTLLLQMLEL